MIEPLKFFLLYSTLPGAAGGLVSFLAAYRRGHYRNNKNLEKFCIEILGAMTTASFVSALFLSTSTHYRVFIAFALGIAWSRVVQLIRNKITKIVETALGEKSEGGKD